MVETNTGAGDSMSFEAYWDRAIEHPELLRPLTERFMDPKNAIERAETADIRDAYVEWLRTEVEAYTFEWVNLPSDLAEEDSVRDAGWDDPFVLLDDTMYDELRQVVDPDYAAAVDRIQEHSPSAESAYFLDGLEDDYASRRDLLEEHVRVVPLYQG